MLHPTDSHGFHGSSLRPARCQSIERLGSQNQRKIGLVLHGITGEFPFLCPPALPTAAAAAAAAADAVAATAAAAYTPPPYPPTFLIQNEKELHFFHSEAYQKFFTAKCFFRFRRFGCQRSVAGFCLEAMLVCIPLPTKFYLHSSAPIT